MKTIHVLLFLELIDIKFDVIEHRKTGKINFKESFEISEKTISFKIKQDRNICYCFQYYYHCYYY